MEPALAIVVLAASLAGIVLVSDLTVVIGRSASSKLSRLDPRLPAPARRLLALAVLAVSCLALVRPATATGATVPPSVRIVEPSVHVPSPDGGTPSKRAGAAPDAYVVERGDCLWRIASSLLSAAGHPAGGADVSRLWRAIYEANRATIGDDPNLILPGQVLIVPEGQV
jgi:nucleoid-associated protein YgaU